jgi:hypothetical protein
VPVVSDGEWRPVPLPAPLQAVGDINTERASSATVLFVDGDSDSGTPRLLLVSGGVVSPANSAYETPPTGPVRRVMYNGGGLAVADSADPPVLWHGLSAMWQFDPATLLHPLVMEASTPVDERGRRPVDVWAVCDDDSGSAILGTVPDEGGLLQVRVWIQDWGSDGDVPVDLPDQLYMRAGRPVFGTLTEGLLMVAGDLSTGREAPPVAGAWWMPDWPLSDDDRRWRRVALQPDPDAITDLRGSQSYWWLAGHRDQRPLVWTQQSRGRPDLPPPPDTVLDPDHPLVLIACRTPLALATQTPDGPTLWTGGDPWTRLPAPPGRLQDTFVDDSGVYLVIDRHIWYRPMVTTPLAH